MKVAAETWKDPDEFYLKAAVRFADTFDGWGGFAAQETAAGDAGRYPY
jgi:hypothetical protein